MANIKLTEQDVIDKLIASAKSAGETSPRVITVLRTQQHNSSCRKVKFVLVVTTNNEALVDALINDSLTEDNDFYFIGSEAQLQGEMEIDYLFFEAVIYVKRK